MAVASLAVTKAYADNNFLTEAILDTAFQSIQTYTKTYVANNFDQLRKDCFSATAARYDFDNDGNANRTYNLFNKQATVYIDTSSRLLSTGDVGAYTNVPGASFSFTPESPGKYRFSARTVVELTGSTAVDHGANVWWIMKVTPNGGSATYSVPYTYEIESETALRDFQYSPILDMILNCTAATPTTVQLQYLQGVSGTATLSAHYTVAYNATTKSKTHITVEKI